MLITTLIAASILFTYSSGSSSDSVILVSTQIDPSSERRSGPVCEARSQALAFDGIDDFVSVPASDAMTYPGSGGWTLELWVKPVIYPHKRTVSIVGQESVGVDARDPWSLRIHPTYFEFRIDDEHGSDQIEFDLSLGVWQHVACVFGDGSEDSDQEGASPWIALYVNGELIERKETDTVIETRRDPVYIGALTGGRFTGLLDDVRVWSDPLEGSRLSDAYLGLIDPSNPSLRAWWGFDESHSPIARDRSSTQTDAILGKPHVAHDASAPKRVIRTGRGPIAAPRQP